MKMRAALTYAFLEWSLFHQTIHYVGVREYLSNGDKNEEEEYDTAKLLLMVDLAHVQER